MLSLKMYKFLLVLFALVAVSTAEEESRFTVSKADQGYQEYPVTRADGSIYKYYLNQARANVPWLSAISNCKASGLQLLTVKTQEKYQEVLAFFQDQNLSGDYWLNLKHAGWKWHDGQPLDYANFQQSDIAAAGMTNGSHWSWSFLPTVGPYWKAPYICEEGPPSEETSTTSSSTLSSKTETSLYDSPHAIYEYYVSNETIFYSQFYSKCEEIGMKPLTIKSMEKQEEVDLLMLEAGEVYSWLGLEGQWLWADDDQPAERYYFQGFYDTEFTVLQFLGNGNEYVWIYAIDANRDHIYICEQLVE